MSYAKAEQRAGAEPADVAEIANADLAAVMRLAPGSAYGDVIAHETTRRQMYDLLANPDDPLWKEIGTQFRDGRVGPRNIFGVDAYCTHLIDAIDKHRSDFRRHWRRTREHLEADQPTRR